MTALEDWLNLTNPGAAVIAAASGGALAPDEQDAPPTGGAAQTHPVDEAHRGEPAPIDVRGALKALQANFMRWSQARGGGIDPFAARTGRAAVPNGVAAPGAAPPAAPRLVTRDAAPEGTDPLSALLGRVAQVNTREGSERQGQALQEYDLGGGQFAHVYYDKSGHRKVFKFRR